MSLGDLRAELQIRYASSDALLRSVSVLESASGQRDASRSLKGLIFVQNYACYEYCVVQVVRALIRDFNARVVPVQRARVGLVALALDSAFTAARTCSVDKTWAVRAELVQGYRTSLSGSVPDAIFPKDGSFFRKSQLDLIWETFGLPNSSLPEPRLAGYVRELVEHRNAIAHGSERPEDVGGRYTTAEMQDRVRQTEKICNHLVDSAEFCIGDAHSYVV